MQIMFEIGGDPAEFRRDPQTGRADLLVGGEVFRLQSPYRPSTHLNFRTRQVLQHRVDGHDVEALRVRPRMYGGIRDNIYTITVDGVVVVEAVGQ